MADDLDLKPKPRPKKKTTEKPKKYQSGDGVLRPLATERQLNEAFAIAFRGSVGDTVIHYLRSISVNRAHEPGTDPNVINQMEGARWLMGIIETRRRDGEEKKP